MGIETILAAASFVAMVASWFVLPGTAKSAPRESVAHHQLATERSAA